MGCSILEWPEPNDRLICGSSGKSVGAHGPLRIEHHLQLFRRYSRSCSESSSGNRGKNRRPMVPKSTERRLGITPIIERHEPEIRFGDLIWGSDVIGQLAYRRLPDTNKIDLFRGHDVVKTSLGGRYIQRKEEDAERANDQSDRRENVPPRQSPKGHSLNCVRSVRLP